MPMKNPMLGIAGMACALWPAAAYAVQMDRPQYICKRPRSLAATAVLAILNHDRGCSARHSRKRAFV